jgi:Spy/CpxP family protein refolding chaperone
MRRSNLSTLLYLLLVFLSGAVVGGFGHRLYMMRTVSAAGGGPHNHGDFRKRYLEEMRTRLHLTDAQAAQLQQIMDATDQRLHDLHKSVQEEHASKILAILNDDQKAEYAKMREEREKRRRERAQKGP